VLKAAASRRLVRDGKAAVVRLDRDDLIVGSTACCGW
jgi:hypothetical protein